MLGMLLFGRIVSQSDATDAHATVERDQISLTCSSYSYTHHKLDL